MRMLLVALVTLTASSVVAQTSGASAKPWCAQIYDRGGDGGRTCGYVNWEQCRATTGLTDGFCLPNPGYRSAAVEPRRPNEPRRHKHR
jgi:Protein of unknown function (DUF3551)